MALWGPLDGCGYLWRRGGWGCAVVVVGGSERPVGGTLWWRYLILLAEMEEELVSWVGTVGAMSGAVG